MKITLVGKIRDAKERKWVTEGMPINLEDINQDRIYSARLVVDENEQQSRVSLGWVKGKYLRAYLESTRGLQEAYVCDVTKEDESDENVSFTIPHISPTLNTYREGLYQ